MGFPALSNTPLPVLFWNTTFKPLQSASINVFLVDIVLDMNVTMEVILKANVTDPPACSFAMSSKFDFGNENPFDNGVASIRLTSFLFNSKLGT